MATENNSAPEGLPAKDSQVPIPEADGRNRSEKIRRRVGERAAGIKNSLPWIKEASAAQQTPQDSESKRISEQDEDEFAGLEDKLAKAGEDAEHDLTSSEDASALAPENEANNAQRETAAQLKQRHREVKAGIKKRRRQKLTGAAVAAGIATGLVLAPLAGGHSTHPDQALATSISQGHPSHSEELHTFYPEIAEDNHETIPIDANTTIFNFTDHEINLDGVRETFAFYKQLSEIDRPIFLEQSGKSFTVHYDNYGSFNFQGSLTQRPARDRAFFLAPPKDHAITSSFVKEIYGDTAQTADSYTALTSIGAQEIPVVVSYIYEPDPHNNPNGTSYRIRFNTETCQSFIQSFAPSDIKFPSPDNSDPNTYVQEGVCGILAQALNDVQNGMSKENFIKNYANPKAPPFMDVGAPMIPLQPWLYDLMKSIKPAVK